MDKNAIKRYAVWARRELIARVSQKAAFYGITEEEHGNPSDDNVNGKVLSREEKNQRRALIEKIETKGYQEVMEEVAYTWFNRFSALRFMEVNGYLPTHVRVFTDEENRFKPQILAEAIHLEMDGLDIDKVYEYKELEKNDELYKYLLITQCNALNAIQPGMFQKISDFTELLFPDNLLREGSVIEQMIALIPEEDWKDAVQIIGWLYQYYNSEKKDEVFAALKKNVKITKENIPAATQLFTPDWIVRYMVENSLGRLWVEGHPNDELKAGWKYYLEEAEQEPEVEEQLVEIRKEYAGLKPEDIKCIDPCSGSGHILAYMFDVLVQIYEAYGYTSREAVASIVENNIYGLDIDERAAQLANFAIMMKARQYDRRFFSRGIQPMVYAIQESNQIDPHAVEYFWNGDSVLEKAINYVIREMHDAKEYGSILNVTKIDFASLYARFDEIREDIHIYRDMVLSELLPLVKVAEALAQKYDVVVTNPPYMTAANMAPKLSKYVKDIYPDYKSDMFSVFINKCNYMNKENGFQAMITQHVWMFIPTYEDLRKWLISCDMINMAHLGPRAFEEIGGEVVQATTFILRKSNHTNYVGKYVKLTEYGSQKKKEMAYLQHNIKETFEMPKHKYELIPGVPYIYWMSDSILNDFSNKKIGEVLYPKTGVTTGDNDIFLRLWFEVDRALMDLKWFKLNKGGGYRKWYGNNEYVIDWENNGSHIKMFKGSTIRNEQFYFREGVTWSKICSGNLSGRFSASNHMFDAVGLTCFTNTEFELYYLLAFMCSKVATLFVKMLNPTLSYTVGTISNLPWIYNKKKESIICSMAKECKKREKEDWDAFETSWDFQCHPLVETNLTMANLHNYGEKTEPAAIKEHPKFHQRYALGFDKADGTIENTFNIWSEYCEENFNQLKSNEEELNRIFIDIYGLQDELTPEVEDKDVTVRKADLQRDIKSLISYAVGCMLGRYSIYKDGLLYAGGSGSDYGSLVEKIQDSLKEQGKSMFPENEFLPDADNIIPICDDEYFEDDITGRFIKFVETVYGKETLDENLQFIADALGGKGQPREVIRNYFLNDFFKDHCKIYQKRPIYWLFDSGKKNGFKALIYMHRYQSDTIARIRTDYVHEQQSRYRTAIADIEKQIADASTSERVKLNKQLKKLNEQSVEIHDYEEKIHHLADQMISIDLDDGVKVNYAKFQDVLAKIK